MVTVRDIAKVANVSVATVSRVINHTGRVGDDTRKRVEKIINDLNYVPNQVARSLYNKTSNLIGVILPDLGNPFYNQIISGIEDVLSKNDYQMILSVNNHADRDKYNQAITNFIQNNISGIISTNFENPIDIEVPLVLFDSGLITDDKIRVNSDNKRGGYLAAKALVDGGAKNIVIEHGSLSFLNLKERLDGATQYLNEKNIQYRLFEVDDFTYEAAQKNADKFLEQFNNFDGVIAANDLHAASIVEKANKVGLKVPEKFQIVGYDNSYISNLTTPGISSISQEPEKIGRATAELLLSAIDNTLNRKQIVTPVAYVKRDTTV